MIDHLMLSNIGDKQIAKRRNENFFRVSARELVSLLQSNQIPVANDAQVGQEESKESIYALMGSGGGAQ